LVLTPLVLRVVAEQPTLQVFHPLVLAALAEI
jgi:hypothetical protein